LIHVQGGDLHSSSTSVMPIAFSLKAEVCC